MKRSVPAFPGEGLQITQVSRAAASPPSLPLSLLATGGGSELGVDTETRCGLALRLRIWSKGSWGTARCFQLANVVCV